MESGVLWREEVTKLHKAEYPEVELSHMYADNCAMQLVRNPKQFDVIVTDNLFGDILSDAAAMLTGRSEEHTSEIQSLMRISYAVFCLHKTKKPEHMQRN